MSEDLKKDGKKMKAVVEKHIEKRSEETEEQEFIKPEPPKDFMFKTNEVEQLKMENIGLKRAMLQQQMNEIEQQTAHLFNVIKQRAGVSLSSKVQVNPQNLAEVLITPGEES
jgi:hypothetical protein